VEAAVGEVVAVEEEEVSVAAQARRGTVSGKLVLKYVRMAGLPRSEFRSVR
jgi:hypothetical protein